MPRRLSLLIHRSLALLFAACLLSACGGPAASTPPDPHGLPIAGTPTPALSSTNPTATAAPTPTALPALETPILWIVRGTAPGDLAQVTLELNGLLAKRGFNARVEIRPIERAAFAQQMAEMKDSGAPWDLVSLSASSYRQWRQNGDLLPLTAYAQPQGQVENTVETYAPGLWASLPPAAWEALLRSGEIDAVPNQSVWARSHGVSIRADVVSALGLQAELDAVKTFRDLTPLLEKIQAAINDGTLQANGVKDAGELRNVLPAADLLNPQNAGYEPLFGPFTVRGDDPQAQVVNWFQTVEFKELVDLRLEWQQAGFLPDAALTPDEVTKGYQRGRYAAEVGHLVGPGSEYEQAKQYGYQWIDKAVAPRFLSNSDVFSSLTGINARIASDPERVQRVLLFLEMLHTDPVIYNLLAYGLTDLHWRWQDAAQKVITLTGSGAYQPDYIDQLGDRALSYTLHGQPVGTGDAIRQWNASAPVSLALGFFFDPRPVAAEAATMQGILNEQLDPLAYGQGKDVEKGVSQLLKALEKAGSPAIQAELERQLSAWK